MLELRDVSVRDLRSFITERGFSHASLLERHELEARAEEAAAAQASQPPTAAPGATASPRRSLCDATLEVVVLKPQSTDPFHRSE
eukprot:COSAG02_NODE_13182_length_1430_cov_50.137345_2_plen_85_part_00